MAQDKDKWQDVVAAMKLAILRAEALVKIEQKPGPLRTTFGQWSCKILQLKKRRCTSFKNGSYRPENSCNGPRPCLATS
jgi:hypothetical protein